MIGLKISRATLAALMLVAALASFGGPACAKSVFDTPLVSQLASMTTNIGYDEIIIPDQFGVGDLNGDGFPDVTSPVPGDSLIIHFGNGDGTLAFPIDLATPGGSMFSTVADFDGDGFMDIAWAGDTGAGISFGDGTGQHWTTITLPCSQAYGIAAGDFDGDGIVDVAILSTAGGHHIQTFLSRPQRISLAVSQRLDTLSWGHLISMRVADLDRDGRADLLVNMLSAQPWTLRSRGDGTFAATTLSHAFNDADLADVTGDGLPDLVEVDRNHLSVCPGLGNGSFGPPLVVDTYLPTPWANSVRVGDLDGDGIPDLITVDIADRIVTYLGTGAGAYRPAHATRVGQELLPIELIDMDRDEHLDVLGMSASGHGMFVARGDGAGGFVGHVTTLPAAQVTSVIAGALDGDGLPDLLLAAPSTNQLSVLLSKPGRTWISLPPVTISDPAMALAIADFNEDGKADALVFAAGHLAVLLGNGDGTFQAPIPSPGGNYPVAIGDVDGDGHLDVVYFSGSSIVVLPGHGDGSFGQPQTTATPYSFDEIAIGDLDGDGHPDLELRGGGVGGDFIVFAHNAGGGAWTLGAPVPMSLAAPGSAIGDLNGDGRGDLVTQDMTCGRPSCTWRGLLLASLEQPDGMAGPWIESAGSPDVAATKLLDFDHDGVLDAVQLLTSGGVAIERGDGTGRFEYQAAYNGPEDIAGVADLDGDGRFDVFGVDADSLMIIYGRDADPPHVTLTAPAPGAWLLIGQTAHVGWNIPDAADLLRTELYVSRHGSNGPYERIAAEQPDAGGFGWNVTAPVSDSLAFKVVARDSAGNAAIATSSTLGKIVASLAAPSVAAGLPTRPTIRVLGPNPSSERVGVSFTLPRPERARITLLDVQGRRMATLFDGVCPAGQTQRDFTMPASARVAGVYFVRLEATDGHDVARLARIR